MTAYFVKPLLEILADCASKAAVVAAEMPAKIQVNAADMTVALVSEIVAHNNSHKLVSQFAENRNEAVVLDFKPVVAEQKTMSTFVSDKKNIIALTPQSSFAASANEVSEKQVPLITLTDEAIRKAVPDNKGKVIQLSEYRNVA